MLRVLRLLLLITIISGCASLEATKELSNGIKTKHREEMFIENPQNLMAFSCTIDGVESLYIQGALKNKGLVKVDSSGTFESVKSKEVEESCSNKETIPIKKHKKASIDEELSLVEVNYSAEALGDRFLSYSTEYYFDTTLLTKDNNWKVDKNINLIKSAEDISVSRDGKIYLETPGNDKVIEIDIKTQSLTNTTKSTDEYGRLYPYVIFNGDDLITYIATERFRYDYLDFNGYGTYSLEADLYKGRYIIYLPIELVGYLGAYAVGAVIAVGAAVVLSPFLIIAYLNPQAFNGGY